jgi:hypothetical protein
MDLHADRDAFETLLLSLSERSTIRADIIGEGLLRYLASGRTFV